MNTPRYSHELIDATSRQCSEFSRASFITARTDNPIYYDCEELEYFEHEIDSYSTPNLNYKSLASQTFRLPRITPRSETKSTYKSDCISKHSNKYCIGKIQEINRSRTTPYKKSMFGPIDHLCSNDELVAQQFNECSLYKNGLQSSDITPKIELIKNENIGNIISTTSGSKCARNSDKSRTSSITHLNTTYSSVGSCEICQNPEKKQEINLQIYSNKAKSHTAEPNIQYNKEISPNEVIKVDNSKFVNLSRKEVSAKNSYKPIEFTVNINKNKIKKQLSFGLPSVFLEGEVDNIRGGNHRSNCIFSILLHFKNICCLVDYN
ncbi:hypothetical protein OJ253_1594 [Cryptosporidium canis]|uniref:Uncharacterized protein n=1 Tax=Cryptosporidium canis TaxID=195482 RepID=A0A9D5DNA4_9CRYT|nr:hypothetical protein OJ253_1594 [Cryptosporidium canis]